MTHLRLADAFGLRELVEKEDVTQPEKSLCIMHFSEICVLWNPSHDFLHLITDYKNL